MSSSQRHAQTFGAAGLAMLTWSPPAIGLFSPAGSSWCCVALSIGVRMFWHPSARRLSFGYAVDDDESWIAGDLRL